MSISQVSKCPTDIERVLNRRLVVKWSEEMMLNRKDHALLQDFVSHQELLARSRNVSVSVLNSHTCESRLLHLQCHQPGQVKTDLSFLGWVNTWVSCSGPNVEALVSDLINHCLRN